MTAGSWGGQLADPEEIADEGDHLCFGLKKISDTTFKALPHTLVMIGFCLFWSDDYLKSFKPAKNIFLNVSTNIPKIIDQRTQ